MITPPNSHIHIQTRMHALLKNLSDSKNVALERDLTEFFPNSVVNIAEII